MKILKLRLQNLNSLTGKWEIDFTDPEYMTNGIFAITGPTGAGKSTILDAVCLALYGSTPRLNKLTGSYNEIMSRRTGECFAELEFSTRKGVYKVNWSQHRAYRKPDGKLNDYQHTLYDEKGAVLQSRKKAIPEKIKEITGLDFKQFITSILLPQGSFASFLQAPPKERAPILEEITGTEIYSEISVKVHEILSEKKHNLALLEAESGSIDILDDEEEKKITEEIKRISEEEIKLKNTEKQTSERIVRIETIKSLQKELKELEENKQLTEKRIISFEPEKEKLTHGLKAQSITTEYTILNEKRKRLNTTAEELKELKKKLPEIRKDQEETDKKVQQYKSEYENYKKEYEKLQPILIKVREKDIQIANHIKILRELQTEYETYKKELAANNVEIKKLDEKISELTKLKHGSEEYIEKNAKDSEIKEIIAAVKEQTAYIAEKKAALSKSEKSKTELLHKIKGIRKKISNADSLNREIMRKSEELSRNITELKNSKDTLLQGRMLREIRTEKENKLRELSYINKIINLEEERKFLEDGKPCPLCGSLHHPYATGNIPEQITVEKEIGELDKIIKAAEENDKKIELLEKDLQAEKEKLSKTQNNKNIFQEQEKNLIQNLQKTESAINDISTELETITGKLLNTISEFGFNKSVICSSEKITELLTNRLNFWNEHKKIIEDADKKIIETNTKKEQLKAKCDAIARTSEQTGLKTASIKNELKKIKQERYNIFEERNPDTVENSLKDKLKKSESELNKYKNKLIEINTEINSLETKIKQTESNADEEKKQIKKLEAEFQKKCTDAGFNNEKEYLEKCLSQNELDRLAEELQKLNEQKSILDAKLESSTKKLKIEIEKKDTEKNLDELKTELSELKKSHAEILENLGGLRLKIKTNIELKEKRSEILNKLKIMEEETKQWSNLHALIGSSDGKKFREFAQGLTFQVMVRYANNQLRTMTDRYLLVRDKKSPLELNVIDNYQAGEIRSTKNLSGGESFIISLALALGLSNMASRNVSIDSLFLDEGFGTLDEDSLEMALESLSTLRQDNKLIGIISHVGALKERINTQINVIPQAGGKSIITGPGCHRYSNIKK